MMRIGSEFFYPHPEVHGVSHASKGWRMRKQMLRGLRFRASTSA
jgi:hypothetical protein